MYKKKHIIYCEHNKTNIFYDFYIKFRIPYRNLYICLKINKNE